MPELRRSSAQLKRPIGLCRSLLSHAPLPAGITIPVCGTHNVPATIIAGTIIGSVVIRWGVPAVSVRWCCIGTAIVAVPRPAIVAVTGAIGVGIRRYATD